MTGQRELDGKIVLVTGAGSVFGRLACSQLASHGARVVAVDLRDVQHSRDGFERWIDADIADESEVQRVLDTVVASHGRIDAAIHHCFGHAELASIDAAIDSAARSTFLIHKHLCPIMAKQAGGAIVVTIPAGIDEKDPDRGMAATMCSHALDAMTRIAAQEWGASNVRVNSIVLPAAGGSGGSLADPNRSAAELASFLSSDAASYISGGAYGAGLTPLVGRRG